MQSLNITGGDVLLPRDGTQPVALHIADGHIAAIEAQPKAQLTLDATGLLVLPGSSISMAIRSSASCSPAPASAFPPVSRCATPRRSCWPTASPPRFTA